jgi:4-diphosphocytidyl-2-C-methyl-D-erythritol kinase
VLSEFAPAKLNLHLHVVGRREDGLHLLDSLVVFAAVGDRLSVTPDDDLSLEVTGPFAAELAAEPDNLVLRAARALAARVMAERALAERAGGRVGGRLMLEKNLPVASGIGGGSADAAAALRLLGRFWGVDLPADELGRMARGLGADVPVCLAGRAALMTGTGDVLTPAPALPEMGVLLVNPGVAVSTQSVFHARVGSFSAVARFPAAGWPDCAALAADLRATRNDLEPAARILAPAIGDALDAVASAPGCLLTRMSGSGATCFGLFATAARARQAAVGVTRAGWWAWGGGLHRQ